MDGWTLIAEGRQAEVYLRPDGLVVKLMRDPSDHPWVEAEALASRAVSAQGVKAPEVVDEVVVDGRPGLVMARIDGSDLMALLGARPWLTFPLGRGMGVLHATVHDCAAPDGLPVLHEVVRSSIEGAPLLSDSQRNAALGALAALPDGDGLCHRDMHLGNLLGDRADPVIIDWGGAAVGPVTADVAQTVLMHRLARPGPGSPPLVRAAAPVGARFLLRSYLAGYRSTRPLDPELVERWVPVTAAARLVHDITDEEPGLLRIVRDAFGP